VRQVHTAHPQAPDPTPPRDTPSLPPQPAAPPLGKFLGDPAGGSAGAHSDALRATTRMAVQSPAAGAMSAAPATSSATSSGRAPVREELYVERLIASLAYHRTADAATTVMACRELQQLLKTPERLYFLLNHPHFQSKGLVVLTTLLEDPTSEQAYAGVSALSNLASDTQGVSALLFPKVMTMDPFAVVAMTFTALGTLILANPAVDDNSVRACWAGAYARSLLSSFASQLNLSVFMV